MRSSPMLLAALLVAAAGCGKEAAPGEVTSITSKGGGAHEMTVKGDAKEGDAKLGFGAAGSVKLPDDWPKDVAVKDGSTVATTMKMGGRMAVTFTWKGTAADAASWYQERLQKDGWTVESPMTAGPSTIVSAKKGKRECTAMLNEDKGSVSAMVTVGEGE